jgi:hypothetical protein
MRLWSEGTNDQRGDAVASPGRGESGAASRRSISLRRIVRLDLSDIDKVEWADNAADAGRAFSALLELKPGQGNKHSANVVEAVELFRRSLRAQGAPVAVLSEITRALTRLTETPGALPTIDPIAAARAIASTHQPAAESTSMPGDMFAHSAAPAPADGPVEFRNLAFDADNAPYAGPGEHPGPADVPPPGPIGESAFPQLSEFLTALGLGKVMLPRLRWSGKIDLVPVEDAPGPSPAMFAVESFEISLEPTRPRLGSRVSRIDLFPGESRDIYLASWRAMAPRTAATVIDDVGSATQDAFEARLDTRLDRGKTSMPAHYANALVYGGLGGLAHAHDCSSPVHVLAYHAGREDYLRRVVDAIREHVDNANALRTVQVLDVPQTATRHLKVRAVGSASMRSVLKFDLHQMTQGYLITMRLADIRVAFSNGSAESWDEAPLTRARDLFGRYLTGMTDDLYAAVMRPFGTAITADDGRALVGQQVTMAANGRSWKVEPAIPTDSGAYHPLRNFTHYRLDPDGVTMLQREVFLRTDSVDAAGVLAGEDALDESAVALQDVETRHRQPDAAHDSQAHGVRAETAEPEAQSDAYPEPTRADAALAAARQEARQEALPAPTPNGVGD